MPEIESIDTRSRGITYVVGTQADPDAYLIDPGVALGEVEKVLARRKWRIRAILLTHGHFGHAARAAEARLRFSAPIYAHQAELPILQRLPVAAGREGICGVKIPPVDLFLREGERFPLGREWLTVVETPGHTPGSLSFQAGQALFVGDLCDARGIYRPKAGFNDAPRQEESLEKVRIVYQNSRIFPGHGTSCNINDLCMTREGAT